MTARALCDECVSKSNNWLDTTPAILNGGIKINSSAAYDDSAQGVLSNRTYRYEQWRQLVYRQISLIREICEKHHLTTGNAR